MKILITGATGFVGRALCERLKASGHDLVELNSKNCDLTRPESLTNHQHPLYDQIYHLAAWTQAGNFCINHPGEQWILNQLINTNVLTWWQRYQPQAKLISIGSSCAYAPDREMVEENYLQGRPIDSLLAYAMSKRMLYVGLLALHKQFNLEYLHIIPCTLYGPGYHTDGRQMHFIFDLIRKILRGKLYNEPVVLWGNGYQKREIMFIDDFVRIVIDLSTKLKNDLINIGVGEEFTIRDYAQIICEEVGFPFADIKYDLSAYIGTLTKCLNIQKLKKLIPDLKLMPLKLGIKKTVSWFQNHPAIRGSARPKEEAKL